MGTAALMIIDSSVLVAIVLEEPGSQSFIDQIAEAPTRFISAASFLECSVVLSRRLGPNGVHDFRTLLEKSRIQIVEFSEVQALIASTAYQRYGKGMGHPAQLNILDCCTYALTAHLNEPLLFKGNDFVLTDLPLAL